MPFSTFRKLHVEDLKAGDRIWFNDAICVVVSVVPEEDPVFEGCHRVYTDDPVAATGRDYIYVMPGHEFLAPRVGQNDQLFIQEVSNALSVMAKRSEKESQQHAADLDVKTIK